MCFYAGTRRLHAASEAAEGWRTLETEPTTQYIGLVLRLETASDGSWNVVVDGTYTMAPTRLEPVTLIVRLARHTATGVLRGTIHLYGSDLSAPFQTNDRVTELARAWLFDRTTQAKPDSAGEDETGDGG
jgi:hypothetical protein